jgi:hypothetical protein
VRIQVLSTVEDAQQRLNWMNSREPRRRGSRDLGRFTGLTTRWQKYETQESAGKGKDQRRSQACRWRVTFVFGLIHGFGSQGTASSGGVYLFRSDLGVRALLASGAYPACVTDRPASVCGSNDSERVKHWRRKSKRGCSKCASAFAARALMLRERREQAH